ncbi:MAG: HD domain-containing protein [Chloroflexi bacterium]|nr:HD domain-containing protein [Chloroflexota bacterium]
MTRRAVPLSPEIRALLAAARELLDGPGYLVGGSLRDLLLGRAPADLDLAVAGPSPGRTPAFARALADRLGGHFVLLDEERGTARIVLDEGAVRIIDVARLRGDIESDLAQRDFTIDAIAAPIDALVAGDTVELIDPASGLRDLRSRTVRLVAEQALVDDPLRLLRAVRIAAQLDFAIDRATAEALRRHAGRIGDVAAERIRDELARCLATPRAAQALRLLDSLGLLDLLLPEVTAGRGVEQPKEHHWDVLGHAFEAVAALDFLLAEEEPSGRRERSFRRALWDALAVEPGLRAHLAVEVSEGRSRATLLKLAGLLHDVAKPQTRAPDATGRIRFFGHAELGAETARAVLRRLRFSRREADLVALMVEEHLRPGQLGATDTEPPTRRALFRFYRDTGDAAESILLLSLADALAARGPRMDLDRWRGHAAYVAHVLTRRREEETIARPQRLLTGDEIMAALAIGPGPAVGRLLDALEEAQADGEVASHDEALAFARRLHEREPALAAAGGRA